MDENYKIKGKVIEEESGLGIQYIRVCINNREDCLAEIVTDKNGYYEIELINDDTGTGRNIFDNLVIIFKAPFNPDGENTNEILGQTKPQKLPRQFFRIDKFKLATLTNAGVKLPNVDYGTGNPEEQLKTKTNHDNRYRVINKTKVQNRTDRLKGFDKIIKDSLSRARDNDHEYLKEEDDLKQKQEKIYTDAIQKINNQDINAEGIIILSAEQKDSLEEYRNEDEGKYKNVPGYTVDSILYALNSESNENQANYPTYLLRNNPISNYCKQETKEEVCAKEHLNNNGNGINTPNGETAEEEILPLTKEEIDKHLGKLVHFQSSPEERVYFGERIGSRRPDQKDVQDSIDSFILEKGPADSVAYYDFKNLNIAFKHIWTEAINKGVLETSKDIYDRLVDLIEYNFDITVEGPTAPDKLVADANDALQATNTTPPAKVVAHFDITFEQWNNLHATYQEKLNELADHLENRAISDKEKLRFTQQADRIIAFVKDEKYQSLHRLIVELNKLLKENYTFTSFPVRDDGRRSVNFGLDITYRQKWEPLNYQAGELAKTITLAPKEERKFSYKTVIKRKRSEKEAEKHSSSIREELNTTTRTEAEIIQKAMKKADFNLSYEGYFKTSLSVNAQRDSQETKKDFREAVHKASQEFKSERSTEVTTEEVFETELTEFGTISNPNDELAVTFLFYELQRRYKVSEEIHRLTPVIMVAERVPEPQEIDESWLIEFDWILRRVILDDSFIPALNYLSTSLVGDEYALKEMKKNLDQQRTLVDEIKLQALELKEQVDNRYQALQTAIGNRINIEETEEKEGFGRDFLEFFGGDAQGAEAAKAREQAAQDAHDQAVMQMKELASKLQREIIELNALTEKYTNKLSQHLNQKTQVERLKVHVKDNIIYYMQAIWKHEPPDQRFMRLYNVEVPFFEGVSKTYNIEIEPVENIWTDPQDDSTAHNFDLNTNIQSQLTYKRLAEVADVGNPIGYMGNYIIFPLTAPNALTDYMMTPYVDSAFGLRDPDEFGNMNLRDFAKYICCLHEKMSEDEFNAIKPALKEYYKFLLTSPLRPGEDMIVPSNSLFIEALPAKHALLEDFKLMHRAIDVKKVQAEVREMELDNLRQAARILGDNLEDPDVEKKIVIEGNGTSVVLPQGE
ncbi:MAG: hypothetical protein CV087_21830 [Candidatus Brocadia sp. WS118]|nr:MAG: hypothetical protein CV087_21830 [Candidatus Brocadia sp. WS118]